MDILFLIALVAVLILLNAKATLVVFRDTFSEKPQKVAQLMFVWFLPLVGAMVVLAIHRREEKSSGSYPTDKNPGDDFGVSGGSLRTITEVIDGD